VIDENAEPPEADTPEAAADDTAAPTSADATPDPTPAAAAPEPELDEDDDEPAPRVKPAIPGADLEVDIVAEGADPLAQLDEEAQAAAEADAEQDRADEQPVAATIDLAAGARYRATGKRKTAVARVILRPGTGAYTINGKTLDAYFPRPALGRNIRQPLEVVGYEDRMDVVARIHGGGVSSQSGALRHGISRALLEADPSLRGELKRRGFLTRDSRVKERKKAGLKKARKRPQFSKR
jgi:small subunit ribosomal protein S9